VSDSWFDAGRWIGLFLISLAARQPVPSPAGDALLVRLGERVEHHLGDRGEAFRMGRRPSPAKAESRSCR